MELARLRADGIRAPEGKECAETWSKDEAGVELNFRITPPRSLTVGP